jgi:hypothetical protein
MEMPRHFRSWVSLWNVILGCTARCDVKRLPYYGNFLFRINLEGSNGIGFKNYRLFYYVLYILATRRPSEQDADVRGLNFRVKSLRIYIRINNAGSSNHPVTESLGAVLRSLPLEPSPLSPQPSTMARMESWPCPHSPRSWGFSSP